MMADDGRLEPAPMDRRRFLLLAGVGAAIGAVVLATTTPRKLIGTLTSPAQPGAPSASATAGKRIWTPMQQTGTSFLSRLFGRPL